MSWVHRDSNISLQRINALFCENSCSFTRICVAASVVDEPLWPLELADNELAKHPIYQVPIIVVAGRLLIYCRHYVIHCTTFTVTVHNSCIFRICIYLARSACRSNGLYIVSLFIFFMSLFLMVQFYTNNLRICTGLIFAKLSGLADT